MQQKTIDYQSSAIVYTITGKGKPVVLLHGFGEDGTVFEKQVAYLKDYFTVLVPHLPGSGPSEMVPDMSIEGMADVIKAIIDSEYASNTAALTVIGHSMGGYITLALAEKYPGLLQAFGLFHSSAFADTEEKKAARLKSIAFIQANGAYEFLKTAIPGLFLNGQQVTNAAIDELVEKSKAFTPEALAAYYHAMIARPDRTAILKNFPHPVLFIIGEHDKAVPFEQSMQQCYLPNQSHIYILRNSAHMGMLEETGKANTALLQFLQQAT